ncbi:hypothetical protein JXA56_03670 [Candidatus Micrarchaeota archaeon]|nr:hypothetical protein [Candidatus Micrarchaeota archaeon]
MSSKYRAPSLIRSVFDLPASVVQKKYGLRTRRFATAVREWVKFHSRPYDVPPVVRNAIKESMIKAEIGSGKHSLEEAAARQQEFFEKLRRMKEGK